MRIETEQICIKTIYELKVDTFNLIVMHQKDYTY